MQKGGFDIQIIFRTEIFLNTEPKSEYVRWTYFTEWQLKCHEIFIHPNKYLTISYLFICNFWLNQSAIYHDKGLTHALALW